MSFADLGLWICGGLVHSFVADLWVRGFVRFVDLGLWVFGGLVH